MLEKVFDPQAIETRLYTEWEKQGYFKPKGTGTPFSVVLPPPNVTGILHMGHALNLTLQDILIRHKRLNGFDTLWVPGTDHAGIATQNVVERQLAKEGKSRFDLGREAFIQRVWQWKEQYGNIITGQVRKMGASIDWDHQRFTMDEGCSLAVKKTFLDLYQKGLIYRGRYLINWCPRCKTALSDVEVEHVDQTGSLWHIRYPFTDNANQWIEVATTRPETMFGDTAIAVNPNDARYAALIGKTVTIPLTQTTIPIIADEYVDQSFGSGAVKITPAHDFNDYEVGNRHGLAQVMVLDEAGLMNENAPEQFRGQDRFVCRKQLVEVLKEQGYLVQVKENPMSIGQCYRCHTIVEPYLSWQWFVNMKALAAKSIDVVKSGKIKFTPKRWEKLYFDWMESIRDWCISRQIWWGHQIPVWYCVNHPQEPIASETALTVCPKCGGTDLQQDPDVLDTWFSSGLWPFETMGWPAQTQDLSRYYPTALLVTGYDILTFWVSRMITMGLEQTNAIPFQEVFIHGLVRDMSGKKMSKSLGNALDPLDLIAKYGTDALRYTLASLTTLGGQDIKLSEEKIESARNFANKIWNSARYIFMIMQERPGKVDLSKALQSTNLADQWIISVFYSTLEKINQAYDSYNYALMADLLWEFIWNNFCDWYLEMSKLEKEDSLPVLLFVLVNTLKVLHPLMPFITEEIWQQIAATKQVELESPTIMLSAWPTLEKSHMQTQTEAQMQLIINVVREIRNLRKEANIPPKVECDIMIVTQNTTVIQAIQQGQTFLQKLAKLKQVQILDNLQAKPEKCSAGVVDDLQVFLSLEGVIDLAKEKTRLNQQLKKLEEEIAFTEKKLNNPDFLAKAPAHVVAGIKQQQDKLYVEQKLLAKQIEAL